MKHVGFISDCQWGKPGHEESLDHDFGDAFLGRHHLSRSRAGDSAMPQDTVNTTIGTALNWIHRHPAIMVCKRPKLMIGEHGQKENDRWCVGICACGSFSKKADQ